MILTGILQLIFFLTASYVGLFSLWRVCEREHVEEVQLFLDKIFIASLLGFLAGKIPSIFFTKEVVTPWMILNPFAGSFSWTIAIAVFFVALYLLVRKLWKEPFLLFDYCVIPLSVFLALLFSFDVIQTILQNTFPYSVGIWFDIVIRVVIAAAFFGTSKLLLYFEDHYRTYFWYRYRRNSAQSGFVVSAFLMIFGFLMGILALTEYPFALISFSSLSVLSSLLFIVSGFVLLYVRSGRLR